MLLDLLHVIQQLIIFLQKCINRLLVFWSDLLILAVAELLQPLTLLLQLRTMLQLLHLQHLLLFLQLLKRQVNGVLGKMKMLRLLLVFGLVDTFLWRHFDRCLLADSLLGYLLVRLSLGFFRWLVANILLTWVVATPITRRALGATTAVILLRQAPPFADGRLLLGQPRL